MSIISCHCSSLSSQNGPRFQMPALAMRMSMCPEFVDPSRHRVVDLLLVTYVAHEADRSPAERLDLAHRLFEVFASRRLVVDAGDPVGDVEKDHVGSFAGRHHGVRAALASSRSGDQRDLSVEQTHMSLLLGLAVAHIVTLARRIVK
jgi:hypothetical protein